MKKLISIAVILVTVFALMIPAFASADQFGGYDMWVKAIKDGTYTRDQVIEAGFGYSDEFIALLESYGFKVYR